MSNELNSAEHETFNLELILKKGLPEKGRLCKDLASVKYELDKKINYEKFVKNLDLIGMAKSLKINSEESLKELLLKLFVEHSIVKIFGSDFTEKSEKFLEYIKADFLKNKETKFRLYFGKPELGLEKSTLIYRGDDINVISKILAQSEDCYFLEQGKVVDKPVFIENPVLNGILVVSLHEMLSTRLSKFKDVFCKNFVSGLLVDDFEIFTSLDEEYRDLITSQAMLVISKASKSANLMGFYQDFTVSLFTDFDKITELLENETDQMVKAIELLSKVSKNFENKSA